MTKSEYRKKAKSNLDFPYSKEALIKALLENENFKQHKIILSYKAIKGEIDLSFLPSSFPDKTFLYPVVKNSNMYFSASNEFKINKWGIEEPIGKEIEYESALMLTPGLLFDKALYRLGRGKGFYDRYIHEHKDKLYTIGISKENQLEEHLPVDCYDQRVNCLIILPEKGENYVLLT